MTLIYYQLFHNSFPRSQGPLPTWNVGPFTVTWHSECNNHKWHLQPSWDYTHLFLCRLSHCTGIPIFLHALGSQPLPTLQLVKRLHPQERFTALVSFLDNALENGKWKQGVTVDSFSQAVTFFKGKGWPRFYSGVCRSVQKHNQVTEVRDGNLELGKRHCISIATEASLIAQLVKNPHAMQETPVRFLGR